MGLRDCATVGLWDCGTVGLWDYKTIRLWDFGTVEPWDCCDLFGLGFGCFGFSMNHKQWLKSVSYVSFAGILVVLPRPYVCIYICVDLYIYIYIYLCVHAIKQRGVYLYT